MVDRSRAGFGDLYREVAFSEVIGYAVTNNRLWQHTGPSSHNRVCEGLSLHQWCPELSVGPHLHGDIGESSAVSCAMRHRGHRRHTLDHRPVHARQPLPPRRSTKVRQDCSRSCSEAKTCSNTVSWSATRSQPRRSGTRRYHCLRRSRAAGKTEEFQAAMIDFTDPNYLSPPVDHR